MTSRAATPPASAGADGEGVKPPLGSFPGGMGLTARQMELLRYLAANPDASVWEMTAALGNRSTFAAHHLLKGLRERGYIRWLPNRHRSIEVLRPAPPPEVHQVPGPFASLIRRYDALPEKPVACSAPCPFTGHRTCADWLQEAA